jgi:hypothetical protein
MSNLWLFSFAIAKAAWMTGIGPAAICFVILARCPFPFCVLRDFHGDDHDVRVPIERFTPFREQLELFTSFSGERQLANAADFNSSELTIRATSRSRKKMWRMA